MASYSLEEFLGARVLKGLGVKFAADGWDDVPTIKMIDAEDMEALELTDAQRDALELRIYLHNRSLLQYADSMEGSGIGLIDLMSMKPADLVSKFGMRKSHVSTFIDTSASCGLQMPPNLPRVASQRRPSIISRTNETGNPAPESQVTNSADNQTQRSTLSYVSSFGNAIDEPPRGSNVGDDLSFGNSSAMDSPSSPPRLSNASGMRFEPPSSLRPVDARKPNSPQGVFGANLNTASRRMFGLVKAPSPDNVTKLSTLEKVSLQQLAPEHKDGVDPETIKLQSKPRSFKASNLWADKATLFFCIRRPGCVMCRAEAYQLFARKPIFDALGIQLVAVLLEYIDDEVYAFWPRYWAGMVVLDENRDFFRALGGGKLMKDNLFTGFFLNPIARLNWKRAVKTGIPYNTKGEGFIKGGLYIVRKGSGGVAYQFVEKIFGDWAPLDEVLQVCYIIKVGEEESKDH
uniref:Peroxiredoxin-like 2A n=1 Tax=Physcomitrium patens TaxID=3218 RepID=A0A7I4DAF2_PHYPA